MTGMANECFERRYTCIYKCIGQGCLNCRSQHRCPPLIVIATRYAEQIAKPSLTGI
jgi:hypothetical protein